MKKAVFGLNVRDIAEIAMLWGLAIVIDRFIKIPLGATGGSINLAMFPLILIALRHGWFKGFIAGGLIFGLITNLLDGYGLACYPLEYLVAFGSIAIIGVLSPYIYKLGKNKTLISILLLSAGVISTGVIRFFAASIDSVILYQYGWIDAFIYNLPYVFISLGVVLALTIILYPVITKLNHTYKTTYIRYLDEK